MKPPRKTSEPPTADQGVEFYVEIAEEARAEISTLIGLIRRAFDCECGCCKRARGPLAIGVSAAAAMADGWKLVAAGAATADSVVIAERSAELLEVMDEMRASLAKLNEIAAAYDREHDADGGLH